MREREEKCDIEQRLTALHTQKVAQVESLHTQLAEQKTQLEYLSKHQKLFTEATNANQTLQLDLEKEKGKVVGKFSPRTILIIFKLQDLTYNISVEIFYKYCSNMVR